jgi:hypothetical protein
MADKTAKKKPIEIIRKRDKTIEVAIRENPAKTTFGRVAAVIILVGFVLAPIATLIYALIQLINSL